MTNKFLIIVTLFFGFGCKNKQEKVIETPIDSVTKKQSITYSADTITFMGIPLQRDLHKHLKWLKKNGWGAFYTSGSSNPPYGIHTSYHNQNHPLFITHFFSFKEEDKPDSILRASINFNSDTLLSYQYVLDYLEKKLGSEHQDTQIIQGNLYRIFKWDTQYFRLIYTNSRHHDSMADSPKIFKPEEISIEWFPLDLTFTPFPESVFKKPEK